jgi:hypothetical protein
MKKFNTALKNFAMTSQLIEHDLNQIETKYLIDLGRDFRDSIGKDESYYPQIEQDIRNEAASMAPHYETFYSLEKTVRRFIAETLKAAQPSGWWNNVRIPAHIKQAAETLQKKEIDAGITPRSDDVIDFCTFGELGQIIINNWDAFGPIFSSSSPKAVEKIMSNLNMLRGPIAHCSPLAEDEIVRLRLTVRDWFRLME